MLAEIPFKMRAGLKVVPKGRSARMLYCTCLTRRERNRRVILVLD